MIKGLKIYISCMAVGMAMVTASCGGTKTDRVETVAGDDFDISPAVGGNPVEHVAEIDSLALNADDLDAHGAVAVLLGYARIADDAESAHQSRKRLVTIRKFVDVYDITLSNNGDDMRQAMERARISTGVDLKALADAYREQLSGEDEAAGVEEGEVAPKAPADSVKPAAQSVAAVDSAAV